MGQGRAGPTRVEIDTQNETGGTTLRVMLLFVLYSIYFFFSLFFFSNWLCRHRPNCVSANFSKYWMVWIVSETVMEQMSIAGEMN